MKYNYFKIGEKIRFERQLKGISQEELSERLHISRNTLSEIENGKYHALRIDTFATLCEIFDCEMGYLLCEYEEKTRKLTDICESTGYNADVINFMKGLPADQKEILTEILLHKSFLEILNRISVLKSPKFSEIQADFIKYALMHSLNGDKETLPTSSLNLVADTELLTINKCFSDIVSDISNQQDTD